MKETFICKICEKPCPVEYDMGGICPRCDEMVYDAMMEQYEMRDEIKVEMS